MRYYAQIAVIAAGWLCMASGARAQGATKLAACQTITEPGAYSLARNIVAEPRTLVSYGDSANPRYACLRVTADFVTIDLAGFAIVGDATPNTFGISSDERSGIAIRNGSVTGFTYSGISLTGSYHAVEQVRAIGNGLSGITLFGGFYDQRGAIVRGNIASGNGRTGISITTRSSSLVDGNVTLNNGDVGIRVSCPSVVVNNMAASNVAGQIILVPSRNEDGTTTPCAASNNIPQQGGPSPHP